MIVILQSFWFMAETSCGLTWTNGGHMFSLRRDDGTTVALTQKSFVNKAGEEQKKIGRVTSVRKVTGLYYLVLIKPFFFFNEIRNNLHGDVILTPTTGYHYITWYDNDLRENWIHLHMIRGFYRNKQRMKRPFNQPLLLLSSLLCVISAGERFKKVTNN